MILNPAIWFVERNCAFVIFLCSVKLVCVEFENVILKYVI